MTTDLLFTALVQHTKAEVDRHGEAHITCPECGHESSPRAPHCSFSTKGFYCFVCGYKSSLKSLAQRVGLDSGRYDAPVRPSEAPRKPATWLANAERLVDDYTSNPRAWKAWQDYKPVSFQDFHDKSLGLGVLPLSQCHHERLIVPIYDGSMIVGIRGRAINCNCPKWLAPKDTDISLYPLYNADALKPGCVVWIVENPVDAIMVEPRTCYIGVACYSTSYWQDKWTQALIDARPSLIVVAMDNDLVGNGGAERRGEFIRNWLTTHKRIPEPRGVLLVNRLIRSRLPAILYDWKRAEYKSDIGSLLMQGAGT